MRERRNPLTATNSFEDEKRENVFAITVNDALHGRYAVVSSQLVRVWLTFTLPHSFSILLERPEDYVLHVLFADGGFLGGTCLLYTSPSPRDKRQSRMPSSA